MSANRASSNALSASVTEISSDDNVSQTMHDKLQPITWAQDLKLSLAVIRRSCSSSLIHFTLIVKESCRVVGDAERLGHLRCIQWLTPVCDWYGLTSRQG
jgi:hypothetical protein